MAKPTLMGGRRPRRWVLVISSVVFALAVPVGIGRAHDVTGSRFSAPVPLSLMLIGAGGTIAITALWLGVSDRATVPTPTVSIGTIDERTANRLGAVLGAGFSIGVATALVVGVTGRQVAAENFATVFTWPVWFRGVGLFAILFANPWPVISPWRNCYRLLCRLEGRQLAVVGDRLPAVGYWPAVIGFVLLVGIIETVTVIPRSPRLSTVVLAGYTLTMLVGGVLFGPGWFRQADPLGVFYRLVGRVGPIRIRRPSTGRFELTIRPPWAGCLQPVSGTALVVFVVGAVYTVSFDGFTNTRLYQSMLFEVRDLLGTGPPTSVLLYGVGLFVFVMTYRLVSRAGDRLGGISTGSPTPAHGEDAAPTAARAFAPTILPIAAAYDVAHNYPYVIRSTVRLVELSLPSLTPGLSGIDPLGWLSLPVFWATQVILIVAGHVIAVVAAHQVAIRRYRSAAAIRRGHLPLVVGMIGYTVVSLWIISRPVLIG